MPPHYTTTANKPAFLVMYLNHKYHHHHTARHSSLVPHPLGRINRTEPNPTITHTAYDDVVHPIFSPSTSR
ncbi:hypothetical protein BU24DRAFT_254692 [Aaosphaeria arxii CBS 175.79]|uniref:Uncharacterized protein n=1 Tax=Aaosphaeria arxii CBS 175.79 TaxID=1450172 RepID=A0A6A5XH55_9PLEO|nr:uncharacterized protein BU24DRAFT_254692 [Aaosphaeria arxii CBS 175.79]KAF2012575.1 hypothetical protein BU24DRAFT_254692 [Aaosphaeria arxii CBS 175.79]